jgi:hypothetical protein
MANHSISKYVAISDHSITIDGKEVFRSDERGVDLLVAAYKELGFNYPKFFKMDNLSKLAFVAAELLLQDSNLRRRYKAEDIGVVVSCSNSSLDTDLKYFESVNSGAPSPSLFVYTLSNVMVGELAIRHGIKGENTCFVSDQFDSQFQTNYFNQLLLENKIQAGISGWADYLNGEMRAFFMLVEKNATYLNEHNHLTVQNLYSATWKN